MKTSGQKSDSANNVPLPDDVEISPNNNQVIEKRIPLQTSHKIKCPLCPNQTIYTKLYRAWDWIWERETEGWDVGALKHGLAFIIFLLLFFGIPILIVFTIHWILDA